MKRYFVYSIVYLILFVMYLGLGRYVWACVHLLWSVMFMYCFFVGVNRMIKIDNLKKRYFELYGEEL